jgi:hypothetical protein
VDKNDYLIPYGDPSPKDYEMLSREKIKTHLSKYITDLIEHDFEKLCNLVYRHDVSEVKFHEALTSGNVKSQAENIADLVIDRELQKVETKKAYKKYKVEQNKKQIKK